MIRIGRLLLGKTPKIAASFWRPVCPNLLRWAQKIGLDLAELRIDLFPRHDLPFILAEIKKFRGLPKLITIRSVREGGHWHHSEYQRLRLYQHLIPKADAIDIELSSSGILKEVIKTARHYKKPVIGSYHNFKKMPDFTRLSSLIHQAKSLGADIVKIAAWARSAHEVQRLGRFTQLYRSQNLITIAMGEAGRLSRITYPKLGSLITFAHLGQKSAPGQWDLAATVMLLRKTRP